MLQWGQGLEFLRKRQWDKAVDDIGLAIRVAPAFAKRLNRQLADAYRGRGLEHADYGEFKKALEALDEAVRLDKTAENYEARGHMHLKRAKWNDAVADFRDAMRLNPEHEYRLRRSLGMALCHRAIIHLQASRVAQAEADLASAKRLLGWIPESVYESARRAGLVEQVTQIW